MKRFLSLLICAVLLLSVFAGCSKAEDNQPSGDNTKSEAMPTVLDTTEYMLYQNIFFNDQGADYDGKEVTKKGTFTILYDEYNSTVRYYVWGYNDNTKCCDWQWEIVPSDTNNLPDTGSLVEVKGTFVSNDKALDGYRIENADINVTQAYKGADCDVDLTSMGGTLERVQIQNMQQYSEKFEGKIISAYGRVESPTSIQHPYYDNCFSQQIETTDTVPAIGTEVTVLGTYQNGIIVNSAVNETTQY